MRITHMLEQQFISVKIIIVVSAGTIWLYEMLRWAGSGPRAVICPFLRQNNILSD